MVPTRRELFAAPLAGLATEGSVEERLAEIIRVVTTLSQQLTEAREQISWLSRASPPVGAVIAFAGEWPPRKLTAEGGGTWTEDDLGWIPCDGRELRAEKYARLKAVLGVEKAPDFRGVFLRGIDYQVAGKLAGWDEEKTRRVGALQVCSTALPTKRDGSDTRFNTNEEPERDLTPKPRKSRFLPDEIHCNMLLSHVKGKGSFKGSDDTVGEPNLFDCDPIKSVPKHTHTIDSGGNVETRPVNCAVYWVIKFK